VITPLVFIFIIQGGSDNAGETTECESISLTPYKPKLSVSAIGDYICRTAEWDDTELSDPTGLPARLHQR
jgi:hypothetical protein